MNESQNDSAFIPAGNGYMVEEVIERRSGSSNGCLWGLFGVGGCLSAPLLVLAFAVLIGVTSVANIFDNITSAIRGIFEGQPRTATITSTSTIVNSVQPLGQLVSISAQFARADIRVSIRDGFENACGFSASHVIQGAIEAGVDLTLLREDDVFYDPLKQQYTLTLPTPQLTSCRVDYIRQYDRSTTYCGVDWDELRLLAQYTGLIGLRDDAIESGILLRAENEARTVLSSFLALATGRTIEISFRQPEGGVSPLPASCNPDVPPGWTYNVDSNSWSD